MQTIPNVPVKKDAEQHTLAETSEGFSSSATFGGARPGFIFKTGGSGLGYYMDVNATRPKEQ